MQIKASATLQRNSIAVHKIILHGKDCRDLVIFVVLSKISLKRGIATLSDARGKIKKF
jgi:hypothetical protein